MSQLTSKKRRLMIDRGKTGTAIMFCFLPFFHFDLQTASASVIAAEQVKTVRIKGVVTDEKSEPLPGARLLIKGTQNGTTTDANGHYSLNVNVGQTVIVSYLGMINKEVKITNHNVYNIQLAQNEALLDEVVVTGYQTISKERSTGSFAKVNAKTFELKRMNDLDNILEGQVAGMVNGQIRGITTMNAVSNPMVVIDGFPVENTSMRRDGLTSELMPNINPEDIENITVLKDAAAASIYGARAANGVIVITTKKAKKGKPEIDFSATLTLHPYSNYRKNKTNSADIISLQRAWAAQNGELTAGGASAEALAAELRENGSYPTQGVNILLDMYTNKIGMNEGNAMLDNLASLGNQYYDQVEKYAKRNEIYQQYNLRAGKSTDKNSFNFSTTYWKNAYEDINSSDNKLGINLTNSLQAAKWAQLDLGIYLNYTDEKKQTFNALSPGYNVMPYDALVNADGSYVQGTSTDIMDIREKIEEYGLYSQLITPMNEINYQIGKNKTIETRAFAKLKIDFTSWLNYNVMFQYETSNGKYELLREKDAYDVRYMINKFATGTPGNITYNLPDGNIFYYSNTDKRSYNFRQQFNLNKTFNERHNIAWILGQEVRHSKINYDDNTIYGYDPELLTWPSYNANDLAYLSGILGVGRLTSSDQTTKKELINRFISFYSNASYTLDDKYVLTGSIRWDRSNLWGTSSKYQNRPLWSAGASWNIDKEDFFFCPVIDMLKLRTSYGIGGNIGRNTAPYLVAQYYNSYYVDGLTGIITSPPNNDIRWEKTTTINIGADFALFNNRLMGSIDYYHKNSVDLLANIQGSPTLGWGSSILTTNNGEMVNKGIEISLNGSIINRKDFSWNATLLYAYNKNEVTKVSIEPLTYDGRINFPTSYPTKGKPLYGLYAYKWAGLNENGDPQVYDAEGNITSEDVQDANAIVYSGTSVPVHSATFTNVLRYKDFEFSAMFMLQAGHKLRSSEIPTINMASGRIVSTYKSIMNRWQKPGDENYTDVPRLLFSDDSQNYNSYRSTLYAYSDKFIVNASNIRLRNISLSYRLPAYICKKAYLSGVRFQMSVENVATIAFDSKARFDLNAYTTPNYVWGIYLNF